MSRTFRLVLLSVSLSASILVVTAGCKKSDAPAGTKIEETKPADPTKAAEPKAGDTAKPADPVKPAEPAKPADPPAAGGTNSELENKAIAMMGKLGDVFAADAKDCEKLATDLRAFLNDNKATIAEMTALEKKQTEAEKTAFEARNKAAQEAAQAKMEPAAKACGDNKNVQAVLKDFPTD
jgi:hypothetical protein